MNPYITRGWFPMLMGCGKWRCPSGGAPFIFEGLLIWWAVWQDSAGER